MPGDLFYTDPITWRSLCPAIEERELTLGERLCYLMAELRLHPSELASALELTPPAIGPSSPALDARTIITLVQLPDYESTLAPKDREWLPSCKIGVAMQALRLMTHAAWDIWRAPKMHELVRRPHHLWGVAPQGGYRTPLELIMEGKIREVAAKLELLCLDPMAALS